MTLSVYEALLNSNAVIEFDVHGNILWANQNFLGLMGYELSEIVGQHHSLFLTDTTAAAEAQKLWRDLASGHSQAGEFKRLTKQNTEVWIKGSYIPVLNSDEGVVKIVKTAIDITEKKFLAQNLESKNSELVATAAKARAAAYAKSVFLANMSHEIRTPLNSIIGITDTLAETKLDHQQNNYVEILQRANHQLMTIINDILDLSKVEAGEIELETTPFNLHKVMDEVQSILGFRAKEKGLKLQILVDQEVDSFLIGDADRLRQILINLISNAIKFTQAGSITLRVEKNRTSRSGNILFSIEDTGIGISKAKFKDIFRPFTQADSTTTRKYGGTGLGLTISQKIVHLMEGQIWLDSNVNQGSTFFFTAKLPPTTERNARMTNPLQGKYHLTDINHTIIEENLRILIVDDVEDNRLLLGIYLQKTGHYLSYAESGQEAVAKYCDSNFDIILMDVQMPDMDGYEATRQIRTVEKIQNRKPAKIFACTANAFAEDIAKSFQAGCDMHISKPIRKDILLKTLSSISQDSQPIY